MKTKFILLLLISHLHVAADAIEVTRIVGEFTFDGRLDESWWKQMTSVNTVQHLPVNNSQVSDHEEIYLAYNDRYFIVAAKIWGEDIRSPSMKRDEFSLTPDYLGIILDTYYDKENALGFFTTPAGLRTDFAVFEDAVGDFPVNLDWNTFWDVKTQRYDDHWTVEMRIPFTSLQFEDALDEIQFGCIVWRYIASKNEFDTWPYIENNYGDWSSFKPSQGQKIILKKVKKGKPVYFSPFALMSANSSVDTEAPYNKSQEIVPAAGLDVKYNLNSNMTLDLTLNTDFAQVEADDAQVNFDRFDLFFPEKRQFFQERASTFDVRMGGPNRIFYSRRIGIDDDGNLEKILGGARLSGRIGNYDIGAINIATREDNWSLRQNATVLRARKKVINQNSYVGAIATNLTDFKGDYNTVYAIDAFLRLRGNNQLQAKAAQSFTARNDNKLLSTDNTRWFLNLEKISTFGFTYDYALAYMGRDYESRLGFENRTNFTSIFSRMGYAWKAPDHSPLIQYQVNTFLFSFVKNDVWQDETTNAGVLFSTAWKSGVGISAFTYFRRERIFDSFNLAGDYIVDEGLYPINVWSASYNGPPSGRFRHGATFRGGDLFNAKFLSYTQELEWNVTPQFNIGLFYNYNPIFTNGGNGSSADRVDVHLGRLRFLYTISTSLSLNGFIQATSDGDVGLGNIRFRYNPREGVDFFLVYNNLVDLNLTYAPDAPTRDLRLPEQGLIAKMTYTRVK